MVLRKSAGLSLTRRRLAPSTCAPAMFSRLASAQPANLNPLPSHSPPHFANCDKQLQWLEDLVRDHFSCLTHSSRIEDGAPATVIERVAQRENADLITIAMKGVGT